MVPKAPLAQALGLLSHTRTHAFSRAHSLTPHSYPTCDDGSSAIVCARAHGGHTAATSSTGAD